MTIQEMNEMLKKANAERKVKTVKHPETDEQIKISEMLAGYASDYDNRDAT